MSDRGVKHLVNVTKKFVLINFNFLSRLLHDYNFSITLLVSTLFCLDLEEPILFA